ncbi:MAG TPA: hypothetical protein VMV21_16615 [Vicinamibacteria bacterium]|nr:hypothetical protein [Vicinamibacteria bacterium]
MATNRASGWLATSLAGATLAVGLATPSQAAPATPGGCPRRTLGPVVANIPSVEVRPQFRLNGQAFPDAAGGVAVFTLWASQPSDLFDGPQLSLGTTNGPPSPVRVVPGVYDVYYSWQGGNDVPRNQLTRILRGVSIRRDRALNINVPMITMGGVKHHNGLPFVDDGGTAALSLRRADGRGTVPLGGILPSEFLVRLIPGAYTLEYDWSEGATLPRNRHAVLRRLSLASNLANLVVNVPSVAQDFALLHNGGAFPGTVYAHGDVVLRRNDREEVMVGSSHEPPTTVVVIPGTYEAHWHHVAGATVPRNEDARFRRGLVVDGSPLVIDVPSLEIAGDILVNGQSPPSTAYEDARLSLASPDGSDHAYLSQTQYGAYSVRVVPGLYDIVYEHQAGGSVLPSNPRATLGRWRVAAQPNRTIDIPAGTYQGSFALNGEPFPGSAYESGNVYLLPLKGDGAPVLIGPTHYGAFERRVLPGLYRSAFGHEAGGSFIPTNTLTTFGPVRRVYQGDGAAAADNVLDVLAATLTVTYQHNGVPLPEGGPQNARLHLQRGDNYLQLLDSAYGTVDRVVMGGTFDLFYQYRGGPDLPRNAFMRFGCWTLVP